LTTVSQHEVRTQRRNCRPLSSTKPALGEEQGKALALVVGAQASERSEESHKQFVSFYSRLDRFPFEIEAEQLKVCHSVLARDPLALDRAVRLAVCPPLRAPRVYGFKRFPCKFYRLCTYCPERRARHEAKKLMKAAQHFKAPVAVLVTWPTLTQVGPAVARRRLGLRCEITTMRAALRRLTRAAWFSKVVRGGALAFECPLGAGATHWHLHAHGIVEAPNITPAFKTRCNREWRALADGRLARFSFEPLANAAALVSYALKLGDRPNSWAPALGTLTEKQRTELDDALAGRRMTTVWGIG
jgi:hypothetical protein